MAESWQRRPFLEKLQRIVLRVRYPVFDREFYVRAYPDVAGAPVDPLVHYHRHGRLEGRRPNDISRANLKYLAGSVMLRLRHPTFDPKFYREKYPDIARSGIDPIRHYHMHGRLEGRLRNTRSRASTSVFHKVDRKSFRTYGKQSNLDRRRETVLVVIHEGTRTGAPIIAYNIVLGLLKKYNVVTLVLADGPVAAACHEAGAMVIASRIPCRDPELAEVALEKICKQVQPRFAIVNSVISRFALPGLKSRKIPTISLFHEFASYIRPRHAFIEALEMADETIFPAEMVRKNAWDVFPELEEHPFPILPQGLCVNPPRRATGAADVPDTETRDEVRVKMGLDGIDGDTFVIVAVAHFNFRKAPDLFVQCAAQITRLRPDLKCHFVWVGGGYRPETDGLHSAFVEDQIARHGLEDKVHFAGEIQNMDAVYEAADLMLLTSRLDPLPCVCMEAMFANVPLICFDKTTGIADLLVQNGLSEACVAKYLDVDDMAEKAVAILESPQLHQTIARTAYEASKRSYDMESYVNEIEALALQHAPAA